ncbi:MAG TPA: hypothetical protein VKB35_15955 [Ktedonobacteraceae bacterium]|nr:hypothetical protein [Ktedonobacteraceae bacterium]
MNQPLSIPPEIILVKDSAKEQQTREQLLRLFERYRLDKWRYTSKIQIEERAIPHSHPVLTLGTQHVNDPGQLLGTYIHEQMHWFLMLAEKFEHAKRARDEFRRMYPVLPVKLPEGCGSAFSNYLHIQINYLEYLGLIELLGAGEGRSVVERITTHYTKIYTLVLQDNERIGKVMTRHNLIPMDSPPQTKSFIAPWNSTALRETLGYFFRQRLAGLFNQVKA